MSIRRLLSLGLGMVAAIGLSQSNALATSYMITVQNDIPGGGDTGQPMTPPVAVVHDGSYSLFTVGAAASAGLETLAEEGMPTALAAEAMGSAGVSAVEVGGGPFVSSVSFQIDGNAGDLFSLVTMLARSNDLITGVQAALPAVGTLVLPMTNVYDAGTEVNTGLAQDIPFYGNNFVGPTENGVVSMISAYTVLDDPTHGTLDYTFPPSATVTIEALTPTSVDDASWSSTKAAYR